MVLAAPALAADGLSDAGVATVAVVGVAGLATVLVATDPQRRRSEMSTTAGGNEMDSVKNYFNSEGAPARLRPLACSLAFVSVHQICARTLSALHAFLQPTYGHTCSVQRYK